MSSFAFLLAAFGAALVVIATVAGIAWAVLRKARQASARVRQVVPLATHEVSLPEMRARVAVRVPAGVVSEVPEEGDVPEEVSAALLGRKPTSVRFFHKRKHRRMDAWIATSTETTSMPLNPWRAQHTSNYWVWYRRD